MDKVMTSCSEENAELTNTDIVKEHEKSEANKTYTTVSKDKW